MRHFSFTKYITVKEGFNSLTHYKKWLEIIAEKSKENAQKTDLFYHEKYEYWQKYLQTEWD
ncbi:hypothetical protein CLOBY_04530 [Clostridium saccharobutylicum]|uniref:hypothetical protein n=1 Tax=Clostridium saccharobutylicum TaxID=169679 RepID=UPI000983EB01|nr:hypothetical protein [Clostridium saccharobutylicum]AQS08362.1 hypothetical protein CLOBY_04530 [Clostridium saccharobutylicum]MBC2438302.1 hypothetical protein [Clostridium saccharobutylicum]NSB88274.1 hypothetical protein [Clostridium saccharobutylicum]NYC29307.1 hypothetical protein [Clostridium saccharobutylicum]OOM17857.1 hypothetical protein CLSAB_12710 [Clostridium saccharobutylicum]